MNIYLLQNFESIDTQPSLGGRYAYPIPYFDNGPATDGCTSVEPVMSKAGVMTHPDCAKYSTEEAVATCESGLRQRGGSSRFSFDIGVTRILD